MDWSRQGGEGPANYDDFLVPAMFAPFAGPLLDAAAIDPGALVLDVACGTGVVSRAAALRAGAGGSVTGIDLSEAMLRRARTHAPVPGAAPIRYLQAGADEIPAQMRGAFDAVTCQQGLQFFPDRPAALRAMRDACAPGGRVAIATWTGLQDSPVWQALADALAHQLGDEAGAMMRSPFALDDPEELAALVAQAGFAQVEVTRLTLPVRFSDRAGFARRTVISGPVAGAFAAAPASAQENVIAEVTRRLEQLPGGEELHSQMSTNIAVGRASPV